VKRIPIIALLMVATLPTAVAQVRVEAEKRATAIPKVCESIVPASIEDKVDIAGLVREAICKGAGDMMTDYTYVMTSSSREKDKKGQVKKEETTTHEVYIPTLRGGTRAAGILLVTSRNGVPVPPDELEKERARAGRRLEEEENKIARRPAPPNDSNPDRTNGMLPLGKYPQMRIKRGLFGIGAADVALVLQTFLEKCELTLVGREQADGRETLVFNFAPRPGALFDSNEKYVSLLKGTIRIDAKDRIVTKLAAWPSSVKGTGVTDAAPPPSEKTPAVFIEMTRLPEGVWLPKVVRLNGADYPTLFDGVNNDTTLTYGEYKRFTTETKDVQLETPGTQP
jgi:hypothetical protein